VKDVPAPTSDVTISAPPAASTDPRTPDLALTTLAYVFAAWALIAGVS
jgi:hypothetical protein